MFYVYFIFYVFIVVFFVGIKTSTYKIMMLFSLANCG